MSTAYGAPATSLESTRGGEVRERQVRTTADNVTVATSHGRARAITTMVVSALARALPGWHGHHWSGGAGALVGRWSLRHRSAPLSCASASDTTEDGWQLGQSWRAALADELGEPYFAELRSFVEDERTAGAVLPARQDQFAAFRACDFDAVRVVILGQVCAIGP